MYWDRTYLVCSGKQVQVYWDKIVREFLDRTVPKVCRDRSVQAYWDKTVLVYWDRKALEYWDTRSP